jgi:hypothetical protein
MSGYRFVKTFPSYDATNDQNKFVNSLILKLQTLHTCYIDGQKRREILKESIVALSIGDVAQNLRQFSISLTCNHLRKTYRELHRIHREPAAVNRGRQLPICLNSLIFH